MNEQREGPGLTKVVQDFLIKHIDSVAKLEALLLLRRDPMRVWNIDELARDLSIESGWATWQLEELRAAGLVVIREMSPTSYQFEPKNPALCRAVEATAEAYVTHRVAIISAIYAKPIQKLHVFAESFRIRKGGDD